MFLIVLVAAMFIFSTNFTFAAEETFTAAVDTATINQPTKAIAVAAEKEAGWKPTAEVAVGIHAGHVGGTGKISYTETMSTQTITVSAEKNGTGLYVQAENFAPFEKEAKETDFYAGFYTEVKGMKIDIGYGRYWVREIGELDYNALYAAVDLPKIFWQIVPFVKAEYDFAQKTVNENGTETSMDGFYYSGGFKREFKIHERVSLNAEVSVGGNTGIYNMPAENLAFAREKVGIEISLAEQWKLKVSVLTQQNLGRAGGIAEGTDKVYPTAAVVWTF